MVKIGVLGLQGAVEEHRQRLRDAGAEPVTVKRPEDLEGIRGLILPGGESTTIGKLMRQYDLLDPVRELARSGTPVFGTCAGMILLAKEIEGEEEAHIGLMDIRVARNSFGRQKDSFETDLTFKGIEGGPFRAVFIRAPHVAAAGPGVEVLSKFQDRIVAVRQGNLLATAFHPELTEDLRIHRYFLEMVQP